MGGDSGGDGVVEPPSAIDWSVRDRDFRNQSVDGARTEVRVPSDGSGSCVSTFTPPLQGFPFGDWSPQHSVTHSTGDGKVTC